MKLLKKVALVAALSSIASYASALTPIADKDLSAVSGRDGVSIAANLNINIGSFVYTDTDTNGGSVNFNNIAITGALAATIDIMNNASWKAEALGPTGTLGVIGGADAASFAPVGDVVRIAIPNIDTVKNLSMKVGGITMGGAPSGVTAPSYGSFAMNDIKLQGTTVYIWAH